MAEIFQGLERIEEARERLTGPSFMAGVYVGRPDFDLLCPPVEPPEEAAIGEAYCRKIEAFLKSQVDPDEIERSAKIPEHVLKGLFALGAFAMKIPKEYGGLGFSYKNYGRVLMLIASWSNILSLTVAVPRYITLIARVPAKKVLRDGAPVWIAAREGEPADDKVHTAFVLDMQTPGVAVRERCQFEGCRGIENAWMTFRDVRIPVENVIGDIGKGLRYALTILNVGRAISIPAICLGMAKQAWQPTLDRANSRITFGKPLAERQTQTMRIGRMATDLFAMEALASLVWHMADQQGFDIRIEAAIAKIFCSEKTIQFLKDAQIIFGGMGYETAESRQARGEPGFPIEQLVRDAEMYRIGEGATDILRPFVAREALSPHLERARVYLEGGLTGAAKGREWLKLLRDYVQRYLGLLRRRPLPDRRELRHRKVSEKLLFAERASRRLARTILYAMARYREALRDDQGRQNRIEEVGEDILTIAATALHAEAIRRAQRNGHVWDLADEFFREAVARIDANISGLMRNDDHQPAAVGQRALRSQYPSLSGGIIQRSLDDYILKK